MLLRSIDRDQWHDWVKREILATAYFNLIVISYRRFQVNYSSNKKALL